VNDKQPLERDVYEQVNHDQLRDPAESNADSWGSAIVGGTSIWEGIQAVAPNAVLSNDGLDADPKKHDLAIVVIGEVPYAEMLGDIRVEGLAKGLKISHGSTSIESPDPEDIPLVKQGPYGTHLYLHQLHPEDIATITNIRLLKEDKAFAAFERNFSIYGMGFIIMTPVVPIYLVNHLQLSYTSNFLAKGIISQIGLLFLSPLLGRLHDRIHPFRFISIAFGMLVAFPVMIIISSFFIRMHFVAVGLVFIAYLMFGIAMAAVNISWNMSSIFFAGKDEAAMYQSVHVTMTGIRGIIAPVLGYILMKAFNIMAVFVAAGCFLVTAAIISYRDYKRLDRQKLEFLT